MGGGTFDLWHKRRRPKRAGRNLPSELNKKLGPMLLHEYVCMQMYGCLFFSGTLFVGSKGCQKDTRPKMRSFPEKRRKHTRMLAQM